MKFNKWGRLESLPEPRKTLIEHLSAHRSETKIASLLAYFFRSNESHGLGATFVKALLQTKSFRINENSKSSEPLIDHAYEYKFVNGDFEKVDCTLNSLEFKNISVKVEKSTEDAADDKKRIDLVIHSDELVICIEFKIDHELNNPLDTYTDQISAMEKRFQMKNEYEKRKIFFVVLTPDRKPLYAEVKNLHLYRQVVLSHFVKVIEGLYKEFSLDKDFYSLSEYPLVEFIQTIKNRQISFLRRNILDTICEMQIQGLMGKFESLDKKNFIRLKEYGVEFKIRFKDNRTLLVERWRNNEPEHKRELNLDVLSNDKLNEIITGMN